MEKPLVWLHGEIKTPPFSQKGRIQAGYLLRQLQRGIQVTLPYSRPLPSIGDRCHELRIQDSETTWRVIYRLDPDAVVILEVFKKKTQQIPRRIIEVCKRRLRLYEKDD